MLEARLWDSVLLCGARRACCLPLLYFRLKLIVRYGDGSASLAGIPSPHHQLIFGEVLDELIEIPVAVLLWIFNGFTKLRVGEALPDHRHSRGRQTPAGSAGGKVRAREIVILMAGTAFFRSDSKAGGAAANVHGVRMPVIALAGKISLGMAVHAARASQDRNESEEDRSIFLGGVLGCVLGRAGREFLSRGRWFRGSCRLREPQRSGDDWHNQACEEKTSYQAARKLTGDAKCDHRG